MFERRQLPVVPHHRFVRKFTRNILLGVILTVISLALGMWGYIHYEKMSLSDAYLNATMILSGMGPVDKPQTLAGKIFAGSYALFSGIIFLVIVGLVFAPLFHRFFHKFLVGDKPLK